MEFSWSIILERGTIPHMCAMDAGLVYVPRDNDRDMLMYVTYDKETWIEYQRYIIANKRAIDKEMNDRYRY